ncbi:uncharacterized protein LAJ45_10880 [Morchella importuna]|nr:uncharacterized protein LAJ45_10880 [Morchella importuna]KAH8145100.1 hypothetical protein LAJ45_10880 [Morchella importuna]
MARLHHLLLLSALPSALSTLTPYSGPPPAHLTRTPLGFAQHSTGGGLPPAANSSYIVTTMPSLRAALQLPSPKTIYVNGTLHGNTIFDNGTSADCQWYIDHSASPAFNFTMYVLSLNETYVAAVNAAVAANGTWEGGSASEYRVRLGKMNGWRGQAQNAQKAWEAVEVAGGTSLVGWGEGEVEDALVGVNVKLSSVDNVHVRNLRIVPPQDCFPAPETYPATWNARYDAISAVTATNIWLDGLILEDGPEDVQPQPFLDGWLVDRFDGLFDAEDGSDNITFSHNIVRNHHKSLLFGGGNKEADRDLGKMRFTIYGNHFNNSDSRNPLMRFGTFHIVNNLFDSTNNKAPLFPASNATDGADADTDVHPFQYHLGVYNQSSVLVSGNVFRQEGKHAQDTSRVFTYSDLTRADIPARLCVRPDEGGVGDTFNGASVDLEEVSRGIFEYQVGLGKAVEGGLVWGCDGFGETEVAGGFASAEEVESYVLAEAGKTGGD